MHPSLLSARIASFTNKAHIKPLSECPCARAEVPKRQRKILMAILLLVIVGVAAVSVFVWYYLTPLLIPSDFSKLKQDYPELTIPDLPKLKVDYPELTIPDFSKLK